VTNPTFHYNLEFVEKVVSPIDHIFFASNPQFVLDFLFDKSLLLRPSVVKKLNRRDPHKEITWGNLDEGFEALKHVTINDYRFIDHMSSRAQIDPRFEIWDDARTLQFLKETAEAD